MKMKQNRPGWKCENMEQRIRKEEVEKRWNIEITGHLNEKTGGGVNMRESCKSVISFRRQGRAGHCQSPDPASSFFLPLLNCSIVELFQCFSTSSFRVLCSRFLLRRVKIRIFTLIELLMRESCKSVISFRRQGRAGRCQSPAPASSFFLPLLNCSSVQLFNCFSTSSFRVFCSRFLLRRVKIRIFTLIELLMKYTCQPCNYVLYYRRE